MRERHLTGAMLALSNVLLKINMDIHSQGLIIREWTEELQRLLRGEEGYWQTRLTEEDQIANSFNNLAISMVNSTEPSDAAIHGYKE